MWQLYALLAAVTAALMTIIAKIGLKGIDPTFATGVRSFFMFLFMLGLVGVTGKLKGLQSLDTNALLAIIFSAVFGALSWLFYFLSLKSGDATKVAALDRLSLAFILVFSVLFLAEKFTWKLVVGTALVTIGAIIVAL